MNGLRAMKTELIEHLKEHKPDFVTLNESKVLPKHKVSISGYESVRKDRSAARGGGGGRGNINQKGDCL